MNLFEGIVFLAGCVVWSGHNEYKGGGCVFSGKVVSVIGL